MEDLSYLRTEYARNKKIEEFQKTAEYNERKRKIVAAETAEEKIKQGLDGLVLNPLDNAPPQQKG